MILTTIEELRFHSPAHAFDSIDGLTGFIDNSEHDFLEDKLGTPLYEALCRWYDENRMARLTVADYQTGYWNRLLLMAQRVVAFDALGRYAGVQGVSLNNAGINQMVAEDYPKADRNTVSDYQATCNKEAHTSLNLMLRQLEQWCKGTEPPSGEPTGATDEYSDEQTEIVGLWKKSRYYYLAAGLIIPSCETMQAYLDISESREKFIRMLPELLFIQEEIIGNSIGEEMLKAVVDFARDGKVPEGSVAMPGNLPDGGTVGSDRANDFGVGSDRVAVLTEATMGRLLHKLRKVMVALLVGRTAVLKFSKEQKVQAHDDGVRMLQNVMEYLRTLAAASEERKESPIVDAAGTGAGASAKPMPTENVGIQVQGGCGRQAACWTPPLL